MSDDPDCLMVNATENTGWAYHPNRDVWVAYTQDHAERISKPENVDLRWRGDTMRVEYSTVEEW